MCANKMAIFKTDWPDMATLATEYKMDIYNLATAIAERSVRTRGIPYDDHNGWADNIFPIPIPAEFWRDSLFEFNDNRTSGINSNSQTQPKGFCFVYGYTHMPFGINGEGQDVQSGFAAIEVNRIDFEAKIKIKQLPKGKRVHLQIKYLREIHDKLRKLRDSTFISPAEMLEYILENHLDNGGFDVKNMEITFFEEHPTDPLQSVLFYEVEGKNGERKMTVKRLYNIISEFNSEAKKNPAKTKIPANP